MSTPMIVIFAIAIVIVVLLAVRRGGPRVTHIERTVTRKDDDEPGADA